MKNKKGSSVVWAFVIIFVSLVMAILLGITVYSFNLITETLGQDVEVGQVNLQNITNSTFGQINTGIINNADTIGIVLLLGMCLLMILNGFFMGSENTKLFFIVDIFLLALFFIPSIYVSQIYETFINSTPLFQNTFINVIPKTSKFMLNLPTIIATAVVLTMILSYAGFGKRRGTGGDEANVLGF